MVEPMLEGLGRAGGNAVSREMAHDTFHRSTADRLQTRAPRPHRSSPSPRRRSRINGRRIIQGPHGLSLTRPRQPEPGGRPAGSCQCTAPSAPDGHSRPRSSSGRHAGAGRASGLAWPMMTRSDDCARVISSAVLGPIQRIPIAFDVERMQAIAKLLLGNVRRVPMPGS